MAYTSRKGSGKTAHLRTFAKTFPAHMRKVNKESKKKHFYKGLYT